MEIQVEAVASQFTEDAMNIIKFKKRGGNSADTTQCNDLDFLHTPQKNFFYQH